MNNTTKTGWIIASAIIVMFMLPTIGMSSSILNSPNSSTGSTVINYLPESGKITNGLCSYGVKRLPTKYISQTSPNGLAEVTQYFWVYYNSTCDKLFYILDSKVNAYNGANINSNNAVGASNTIYNSIYCPEYVVPEGSSAHHLKWSVPYGYLQDENPGSFYQSGLQAQVTVSSSVTVVGSGNGISGSTTVGVSYTYDLYDFCMEEKHGFINNDQWQFESHLGGQTYMRFVTVTMVNYKPGHQQAIDYSSIGNTTYIKSSPGRFWTTNYCTVGSSLQLTSAYCTPVLN